MWRVRITRKFSDYIEDFLLSKEIEEGCSPATIKAYNYDLQKFINLVGDIDLESPIIKQQIRVFLKKLKDLDYAKKSIGRKIACLKSYFKFLTINEYLDKNPMLAIKSPRIKIEESLPKFLELSDIELLFKKLKDRTLFHSKKSQRYYLEVRLFYSTMARIGELVNIKIRDIDFNNKFMRLRGKGNKERLVPIDNKTIEIIKEYLEKRIFYDSEDYLLINVYDKKLSTRSIQNDFQDIKKKLNLPGSTKFTPHILRHTGATHLRRAGMDISELQDILGHSSPTTTMIYAKNDITRIMKSYSKMHPLNNNLNL